MNRRSRETCDLTPGDLVTLITTISAKVGVVVGRADAVVYKVLNGDGQVSLEHRLWLLLEQRTT